MFRRTVTFCLLLTASTGLFGQAIFSLDDDPSAPVSGPLVPGYFSAEDPLGCLGIQLGPSRSLAMFGWADSDILVPGPAVFAPMPGLNYVDSLSSNHAWNTNPNVTILFSVDRLTQGMCGSALQAQAAVWDQPGDIYASNVAYTHPAAFLGALAAAPPCWSGWTMPTAGSAAVCGNWLLADQAAWGLVSNSPNFPCPLCHDNVDAVDYFYTSISLTTLYWTLYPADAFSFGFSPADIFFRPPGFGGFNVFANSASMGLNCYGPDSIDGLAVFDRNLQFPNPAEAGIDFALFTLSSCSGTLTFLQGLGLPVDAATVFYTDFNGNFAIYLWSMDLGINGNPANMDALDFR